jgi:hypothetical protein
MVLSRDRFRRLDVDGQNLSRPLQVPGIVVTMAVMAAVTIADTARASIQPDQSIAFYPVALCVR